VILIIIYPIYSSHYGEDNSPAILTLNLHNSSDIDNSDIVLMKFNSHFFDITEGTRSEPSWTNNYSFISQKLTQHIFTQEMSLETTAVTFPDYMAMKTIHSLIIYVLQLIPRNVTKQKNYIKIQQRQQYSHTTAITEVLRAVVVFKTLLYET